MRILPSRRGEIFFDGKPLEGLPLHKVAQMGIAYVQETRAIFPSLSVRENLHIAQRNGISGGRWTLDRVFDEFPVLRKKAGIGGTQLSGGEQQMLAIARGLVSNPRLLLLDEPSEGLAPLIVQEIGRMISFLKAERATILLVEQNFAFVTELADENIVLGKGLVRWRGGSAALRGATDVMQAWLGVAA
jgi:branched-chain amino acid transport system ATP-binding protein